MKGLQMARTKKEVAVVKSTIYNTSPKTKAELRAESADAIAAFLARGGVIEQGRKPRARKGSKMACKSSRGFQGGTSGFATGFPRKSTGAQ
jgi:cytochrome c